MVRSNGVPKNSDRTGTLGAGVEGVWRFLKPGHDPIILARTPCDGTTVRNAMEFGCGLLNLDACRIPCKSKATFPKGKYANPGIFGVGGNRNGEDVYPESRCPTNIILDEKAAQLLDKQHAGASRFYYCSRATTREKNTGLPPDITNDHPCAKPLALCRYLATSTSSRPYGKRRDDFWFRSAERAARSSALCWPVGTRLSGLKWSRNILTSPSGGSGIGYPVRLKLLFVRAAQK